MSLECFSHVLNLSKHVFIPAVEQPPHLHSSKSKRKESWAHRYLVEHIYRELGLSSVYSTGRDAWLVIFARYYRMFAYRVCLLSHGKL